MARLTSPRALSVLLALAVLALYWPATSFEFSQYDDAEYYTNNEQVQAGLGWSGVVWAFCTNTASNWHPLTWLSLMMDADMSSGPKDVWTPHFTNILLHALDSVLLFWLLYRATSVGLGTSTTQSGAKWRSLLVAALFALHPLNVESVAWVAERKNVLSMFFFLCSLLAYVEAMRQENMDQVTNVGRTWGWFNGWIFGLFSASPANRHALRLLWLALGFFALALMSKPMVVTLPFVLLLLDVWPLGRLPMTDFRWPILKRLVAEKWVFFLLSIVACVVTYLVQQHGGAVQSAEHFPWAGRVENALVSYARYLGKTFWPVNMAIFYPRPHHWPAAQWCLAAALVAAITLGAFRCRRNFPYVMMGWCWFLGTLVPVIGLIQAGTQAMADRYAYLPLIGIFIAVVWGGGDLLERLKIPRAALILAGATILFASSAVARHQLNFWQNDGTLFGHALAVTENNVQAELTLGAYLEKKLNQPAEAAKHYRAALAIDPGQKNAHYNLGNVLDDVGQPEASIAEYRAAIRSDPAFYPAFYNLALLLERLGRREEAITEFKAVLQIKPDFVEARQHLQALGAEAN